MQAAQASPRAKAYKIVCLFQRTSRPTRGRQKRTTKAITAPTQKAGFPRGGKLCSKDSFVVNQTLVLRMKLCAEKRQLLVAANRQTV